MVACALSRDPAYRFACGVDNFGDANPGLWRNDEQANLFHLPNCR